MKRILKLLGSLLGLLALVVLAMVLVTTFRELRERSLPASQLFQSPIQSPTPPRATPSPSRATPTPPHGVLATLPPMAAKATVAALGAKHTPQPHPLHPIRSPQDIVNIVLNDPEFQANLNDPIFGPRSKDAIPGEPIFVKSLTPNKWDYYLVPFYKDGKVSGVAVVGVKDGAGEMGMWANASGDRFPPISAAEAKDLVETKGFTAIGEPQLVFRWLREGGDETDPFWEVKTVEGPTFYVIHILGVTKVYRADEVHPID